MELAISDQVALYSELEEEGIYKDFSSIDVDTQDVTEEDNYLLARSLSVDIKPASSSVLAKMLSHRVLTKDEEQVLARKIHLASGMPLKSTDTTEARIAQEAREAVQTLMLFNLRLVWMCAEYYGISAETDTEDLMQEGIFGLLRAIEKFDHTRNLKFSTYAVWWIRQSIIRFLQNNGAFIRIPAHLHTDIRQFKAAKKLIEVDSYGTGSKPTLSKIANELDWDIEKTLFISQVVLLENTISVDSFGKDADRELRLPCPSGNHAKYVEENDFGEFVRQVTRSLPDRARDIVERRFGINETWDEQTLEEIGQDYSVTRERIRQIEAKALKTLRVRFIAYGIDEDNIHEWLR